VPINRTATFDLESNCAHFGESENIVTIDRYFSLALHAWQNEFTAYLSFGGGVVAGMRTCATMPARTA
jgi:hypothetical protein